MRGFGLAIVAGTVAATCLLSGCQRTTSVEEISAVEGGSSSQPPLAEDRAALAGQWPGWRGPLNNGVAPDNDATRREWDETSVLWESPVAGRGHSSPVVVGDLVMLATADESALQQSVVAYDRKSGEKRWATVVHKGNFPAPGEVHKKGTNANGTVACDGERVYCVFLNGGKIVASALNLKGEPVWNRELGAFNSKFGYAPSPILYRELLLVAADNRGGGYLVGVDRESGKIVWRKNRPEIATYSSPFVAHVGGKDQLVISGCHSLCSYDPRTGDKNWETKCIAEATCGTVVTDGERFFASGGYPERQTVGVSASGEILWHDRNHLYEPSMVCLENVLVGVSDRGVAYGWNPKTGKMYWEQRIGGSFSASPVAINGLIYVPDLRGNTYVFEATESGLKTVATNQLGDDSYASPAIVDGQIFLRVGFGRGPQRTEKLICISAKE
jgi:outer membrane protein assembly factor BamB